ncbi:collagen alpha-1(IV) chain isoform X2 [Drosophila eugracilis]|uniref:collagen alpha-1(IV) chain isoform X2 n=1 Tax=Drosophila eugracilis TaxID=29029 RepID=UPI0007E5D490|nr:collagen alpha-1(IV) chain isoform X2 [Drosophila eugracilis]
MVNWKGSAFATLALILIASTEGSQFSRDESQEDQKTEFNLASTLTGGITSSRHRQRADLNSQLYPGLNHGYTGATGSIDDAHGHEQGGSGVRVARGHQFPAYPPPGFPGQQAPVPYPAAGGSSGGASSGGYQSTGIGAAPGYPGAGAVPGPYPTGLPAGTGAYPGYPYPGVYLQQYPGYPQPAQFPAYGVVPGAVAQPGVIGVPGIQGVAGVSGIPGAPGVQGVSGIPGAAANGPATSSQNFHRYPNHNAADRNHWDHHFSMNTEYKEDGVHKGPFGVLNNHNAFGYGSGYGGGYNGAFNSPAY